MANFLFGSPYTVLYAAMPVVIFFIILFKHKGNLKFKSGKLKTIDGLHKIT